MYIPNPKLDTGELFYPKRKPVGKVQVDWSNPLTDGLVACWVIHPNEKKKLIDLCGNVDLSVRQTYSFVDAKGLHCEDAIITGEADAGAVASGTSDKTDLTEFTFICQCNLEANTSSADFQSLISRRDNANYQYHLRVTNGNVIGLLTTSGTYTSTMSLTAGKDSIVACSRDSSSVTIMKDGRFQSGASSGITSRAIPTVVGSTYLDTSGALRTYFNGQIKFMFVYDWAIPKQYMSSLNCSPYQFLIPA